MLYIYRRAASEGADTLAEDILMQGTRCKRTRGKLLANVIAGDSIISWGDPIPQLPVNIAQVNTLNNVAGISKFTEAQTLAAAGVKTITVSRTKPAVRPAARAPFAPAPYVFGNAQHNYETLPGVIREAQAFIERERQRKLQHEAQLALPAEEWLARKNNHVGGNDLLAAVREADFYSRKENIVEEYRLHMFLGKSIRAGKKEKQATRPDGRTPAHNWIRSFDAGWKINYQGFKSNEDMRKLAAAALKALKLDFGAVDMGKLADGSYIVLEVNRAPGVEGGTSEAYAKKIIAWSKGELKAE